MERSTVTLVFDKGTAALDHTLLLKQARVGWISALPWNQAPAELRQREVEKLPLGSSDQPGVHAAAEHTIVHGQEYLCVLKYSSAFAGEQLQSITTSLSKELQSLRFFALCRTIGTASLPRARPKAVGGRLRLLPGGASP